VEEYMTGLMIRLMRENDCPPEQFKRDFGELNL
jgi:hypothetical protein